LCEELNAAHSSTHLSENCPAFKAFEKALLTGGPNVGAVCKEIAANQECYKSMQAMPGTIEAFQQRPECWECSAEDGVVAGIIIMLVIMIGCCIGLCISNCGQQQQPAVIVGGQFATAPGNTKPPLIAFSPGCVGLWMCPLACMLCALLAAAYFFSLYPGPGGTCWLHEQIIALNNDYAGVFVM